MSTPLPDLSTAHLPRPVILRPDRLLCHAHDHPAHPTHRLITRVGNLDPSLPTTPCRPNVTSSLVDVTLLLIQLFRARNSRPPGASESAWREAVGVGSHRDIWTPLKSSTACSPQTTFESR